MPRYSVSGRATVVGTAARGVASLYGVAAMEAKIAEVGVFNTTVQAVVASLTRMTNATGVGTGLTEVPHDGVSTALCTAFAGHTGDGGIGGEIVRADLGAAIGAGAIWTFDKEPLRINNATADGIAILCPIGTGQILDYYIIWDE